MATAEPFVAHRNELAFGRGGTRRFCEPFDFGRPQHILLAGPRTPDIFAERVVVGYRHSRGISLRSPDLTETVIPAEYGTAGLGKQPLELLLLHPGGMLHEKNRFRRAAAKKKEIDQLCQQGHILCYFLIYKPTETHSPPAASGISFSALTKKRPILAMADGRANTTTRSNALISMLPVAI